MATSPTKLGDGPGKVGDGPGKIGEAGAKVGEAGANRLRQRLDRPALDKTQQAEPPGPGGIPRGALHVGPQGHLRFVVAPLGGEAGAKAAGKMRLEGKEYVVRDGDVMLFRFAN